MRTASTYYFDSVTTSTNVTNPTNAVDGSTGTVATFTSNSATLSMGGTTAPSSGDTIRAVHVRAYGSYASGGSWDLQIRDGNASAQLLGYLGGINNPFPVTTADWTEWTPLQAPTAGWTWLKVANLWAGNVAGEENGDTLGKIEVRVIWGDAEVISLTGFETGNASEVFSLSGSSSLSTAQKATGDYALLCPAQSTGTVWLTQNFPLQNTNIIGFKYRSDSGTRSNGIDFLRIEDGTGICLSITYPTGSGTTATLRDANGTSITTLSSSQLPVCDGQWHNIVIAFNHGNVSSYLQVWVDGSSVYDLPSGTLDLAAGTTDTQLYLVCGTQDRSNSLNTYWDDVWYARASTDPDTDGAAMAANGGAEVFGYVENKASATPDDGGDNLDTSHTTDNRWSYMRSGQGIGWTSGSLYSGWATSAAATGSCFTDHDADITTGGGPTGDARVDGDENIIATMVLALLQRSGGSGTAQYVRTGYYQDNQITTALQWEEDESVDLDIGTAWALYRHPNNDTVPLSNGYSTFGLRKDSGGQDLLCGAHMVYVLHLPAPSGPADLAADAGSYNITGVAADLDRSLQLEAVAGSYSITGVDAQLSKTKKLEVDAGSYSITGVDTDFAITRHLEAIAGSYSITGVDADFLRDYSFDLDAGSYAITGVDVDALADRYLGTGSSRLIVPDFTTAGDTQKVWTNDASAVDGSTATYAFASAEGTVDSLPSLNALRLSGNSYGGQLTNYSVQQVRVRIYCSATGTGTPGVRVTAAYGRNNGSSYFPTITDTFTIEQATPQWSNWITLTTPPGGWGQENNLVNNDQISLYIAGIDPTGTLTEVRVYEAEFELTSISDAYYITGAPAFNIANRDPLALDAGSYSITGVDADLLKTKQLQVDAGSYSITGVDANFALTRSVQAVAGSYSITGVDAELDVARAVDLVAGNYSITGADANFSVNLSLQLDAGSYSITGVDAELDVVRAVDLVAGSYIITGVDADLTLVSVNELLAESGSYSIGGVAPNLAKDVDLHVDAGSYNITGEAVDTDRALQLKAVTGNYSITGAQAGLTRQLPVGAVTGNYAITGVDVDLLRDVLLAAESGSYTITGVDADFNITFSLDAEAGLYTITGEAALLQSALQLGAEAGSYSITGEPMTIVTAGTLVAQAGAYTITGADADLIAQLQLLAESGSYTITGVDADLSLSFIFNAESGTYTITGEDAALKRVLAIGEEAGVYAITGEDANLVYDTGAFAVDAGMYTLTGFDANLNHITSARRVIIVA